MRNVGKLLLCGTIIFYLILLSHHSSHGVILSRYSPAYFFFLICYPLVLGVAWIISHKSYGKKIENFAAQVFRNYFNISFMKRHFWRLMGLLILFHVFLVCRYLPPSMVFSSSPILNIDYAHHFHQVNVIVQTLTHEGKFWVYDPSFCAGYPEGTLFDVDMKFIELASFALNKTGVGLGLAYNLAIFSFFLLPPFLLLLACHNFRFSKDQTLLGITASILLWHAFPMIVTFNSSGMCSFVFATYWAILSLSVFHRFLSAPSVLLGVSLFFALAIGFAIHILGALLLFGPMLVLYTRTLRPLSLKHALLPIPIALAAVAVNAWWIITLLRFMPYRINTSFFEPQPLSQLIISIIKLDDDNIVLALLGIWGFYSLRSRQDQSISTLGIAAVLYYYALAYLTSNIALLKDLEVMRFTIPGAVISLIGLAMGLSNGFSSYWKIRDQAYHLFPLMLVSFAFCIKLLIPHTFLNPAFTNEKASLQPLVDWIATNTNHSSRIALMDLSPGVLTGAKVQQYTDRAYIGGPFSQMNLVHSYASFSYSRFFDKRIPELKASDIHEYARLFNIHWLITTTDEGFAAFSRFPDEMKLVKQMTLYRGERTPVTSSDSPFKRYSRPRNEIPISIFEVNNHPSFFIKGAGSITASLNRIEIKGATPGETIIKFHWLPTLAVNPPLPIKKYEIKGNPVGFIQVDNGMVRDFTIYNSYHWPDKASSRS